MSDQKYIDALKQYFGYDSFRSIQLDIIRSIGSGNDTLGLMPTGGGKSVTFQVPALTMEGVCIVITPLIALMKDQVEHLKQRGIKAEAIHSGLTYTDIQRILDNAVFGAVKFLYVSPERLSNQLFLAKIRHMEVCFFAVDEAHCISQWGYDFRPSYLKISDIRTVKPDAPLLALTASATPKVVRDIQEKLQFGHFASGKANTFRMSFKRDNLSYVVRRTEDKDGEMVHILQSVPGSAIVYTRNRDKTKTIAAELQEQGISATFYHAALDSAIKDTRQEEWQQSKTRVMVATNAFGMGIDKPDVRVVIHMDCPDSLEAYYQEAGRAGRDGKRAYAVLLYNRYDRTNLLKRCSQTFPPRDYIRKVYDHLAYFFELAVDSGTGARYEFDEAVFCKTFHHYPSYLESAIAILQNAGLLEYNPDPDTKPRVKMNVTREDLYHISDMSALQNRVITALLRFYGSLFVDFVYIDDGYIANRLGIEPYQMHLTLKELKRRGIIKYVPRRNVPMITFLRDRVDGNRLRIERDIYEDLMEKMTERVSAVIRYAEDDEHCRQQLLLDYFGENDSEECGHCDVCIDSHSAYDMPEATARQLIDALLGDGQRHDMGQLRALHVPHAMMKSLLAQLLDNGELTIDGPFVTKKS